MRPRGPYPLLALHGEQGSAKSTTARVLRGLIDPNTASLRSDPREGRDLMIAATNGWCVALDNLSRMPVWLSDGLCRLATGGGFATRELYADDEEILFDAQRPVILTGIEELATRADLLDRAILIYLPTIPGGMRRAESAFWRDFNEARPRILGGLLDCVCAALRNEPHVKLPRLPRMADFAVWATAAEPALGLPPGGFMAAYERNAAVANDLALESSTVAAEVLRCMEGRDNWTVSFKDLLSELERPFGESTRRPEGWPKSPRGLTGELTRIAVNLRKAGVNIKAAGREGGKGRSLVTLNRVELEGAQHSQHSQSAPTPENGDDGCGEGDRGQPVDERSSQHPSQGGADYGDYCEGCERGECNAHAFSEASSEEAFRECEKYFTEMGRDGAN